LKRNSSISRSSIAVTSSARSASEVDCTTSTSGRTESARSSTSTRCLLPSSVLPVNSAAAAANPRERPLCCASARLARWPDDVCMQRRALASRTIMTNATPSEGTASNAAHRVPQRAIDHAALFQLARRAVVHGAFPVRTQRSSESRWYSSSNAGS